MILRVRGRLGAAGVVALALIAALAMARPTPVRAGVEEWSTFDVERMEDDDESVLDHLLTRPPREWRDAWERAPLAIRTAQGCLTSGQWFIDTDLKLRTALGPRAWLGVQLQQSESDLASYDYMDFHFQFPTGWGTPGAWFRPIFDKSRQDLGLTWTLGADTTTQELELAFVLEDVFNNLWAFRQTQVGGLSEPYERRPYEPGFSYVLRSAPVRAELLGRWLTPSRKRVTDFSQPVPDRITTLWGTLFRGSLEVNALGFGWEAAAWNQQASSSDRPLDNSTDAGSNFRRGWSVETAVRRSFGRRWNAEARYLYFGRDAFRGPPFGPSGFGGVDRVLRGEINFAVTDALHIRVGGMHDRITISQTGPYHPFSYGTRVESRTYVGLSAHIGRVWLSGVEGIEMDPEPYPVWFVHDKGFLHLQATF